MKVYIPNCSTQSLGGGWTFIRNLMNGLRDSVQFVDTYDSADIVLICGVTLADRNEIEEIYKREIPIVFRVDNIPKKSRNKRGRVYDNMHRYGEIADMVVYQSEWAQEYAGYMIDSTAPRIVIYNGVDQSTFYPDDHDVSKREKFLIVNYNRDENKRFPEAAYYFHKEWRTRKNISLTIVGNFSPEYVDANFDFFDQEKINFIPPIENPRELATIYRTHDVLLFPAFMDAAPNTVLEARASGLLIECTNPTGGTQEMIDLSDISLQTMCDQYFGVFNLILNNKTLEV